jgi:very-short-patch-repair endonuclease
MPTPQTNRLVEALRSRGIETKTEHWDGHKHIDIYIPENGMYIEVEGLQHFTSPEQIIADLKRDYYSDSENHFTFRITNQLIETHLEEIADAVAQVVKKG